MIVQATPSALAARYFWHTAVGATVDVRQFDPSGQTTKAQLKKRPAIGFIAGSAGGLCYIDSASNVQWIPVLIVGQFYSADIQQLVLTANVTPAETGTPASVTSTAFKLTLYWAP